MLTFKCQSVPHKTVSAASEEIWHKSFTDCFNDVLWYFFHCLWSFTAPGPHPLSLYGRKKVIRVWIDMKPDKLFLFLSFTAASCQETRDAWFLCLSRWAEESCTLWNLIGPELSCWKFNIKYLLIGCGLFLVLCSIFTFSMDRKNGKQCNYQLDQGYLEQCLAVEYLSPLPPPLPL